MAEQQDEEVYCLCRKPYHSSQFMIECDVCKDWFHGSCVGIEEHQAVDIETYHCPNCQPSHGPLTLKRRRNWHRHDYSEINDGRKAVQSGTVIFVNKLKQKHLPSAENMVVKLRGSEVTVDYFEKHGFKFPIIVEEKEGLGMKMPPPDFSVSDVERCVGSLRELDVIDVARQDDIRMKMREWTEYYENTWPRRKVLNVISLEFTGTPLSRLVSPPSVVQEMDWIERHWPQKLSEDSPFLRPQVQKYCLMGVKDSYTDFHVDFGGTSVWYHIIRGEKLFYLIPPTEESLLQYEEWVMSSNQSEVFFGDLVPECYQFRVLAGYTLFIPTGWIHAVLTPVDSLVFGGNFLHRYNIGLQLRIYEMELRLETPARFLHPSYEALTWFAASDYLKELKDHQYRGTTPPEYLTEGVREMLFRLESWTRTKEILKLHKHEIPEDVKYIKLIEQLSKAVRRFEMPLQPVLGAEGQQEGLKFRIRKSSMEEVASAPPTSTGRRGIKLRLSSSGSQVVSHAEDEEKQRVPVKLSVPQPTVVSRTEEDSDSDLSVGGMEGGGRGERRSSGEERGLKISDSGTPRRRRVRGRDGGRREESGRDGGRREESGDSGREEEGEYEDGDFVYPSLVNESDVVSGTTPGSKSMRRKRSEEDDDLWIPQGPVKLMKGSIASSPREKRNARKRSFEKSLSATAAKIVKLEQDMMEKEERDEEEEEEEEKEERELKPRPLLVPEVRATDPVLGGGSLRGATPENKEGGVVEVSASRRARATAAASAVDAVLAASRPKSKPLTAKQRLGKIMGLNRGGRWK